MSNYESVNYPKHIKKYILVQASSSKVWEYLTNPDLMHQWMGDREMNIEVITDWKVGNPFVVKGFHHLQFENKGTLLQFDQEKVLQYNYLSSLSNLEDKIENYSTISFYLDPKEGQTELRIEAENFPTEAIYKHLEFYWNGTVYLLKQVIENEKSTN